MAIKLNKVHDSILIALAKWDIAGKKQPDRRQVALMAGCADKFEGFKKNLSKLKKEQFVVYPDGNTVELTEKGHAHVGSLSVVVKPASNDGMQDFIKSQLLKGKREIEVFDFLKDGGAKSREEIGIATNYLDKPEGFKKLLSSMKSRGVLEFPDDTTGQNRKMVQLTEMAFPLGRPGSVIICI
jgi:predicted transcriptional regulator